MVKAAKKTKKNVKSKTKKKAATSKIGSTSDSQTTVEKVSNESSASIVHTDLHSSLSDSIFKDSFDKFLGDRCDRRNQLNLKENVRASFNRDSSFECSTISEAPDLSVHTVCSTPNFKFNDRPRISTPVLKTTQNYSSRLFASFTGSERSVPIVKATRIQSPNLFASYERSLNGSQQLDEYLNRASENDSPTTLHESENRTKKFVTMRRKKKSISKTAAETTPQNINNEQNDSPGEDCVVPFSKKEKLIRLTDESELTSSLCSVTNRNTKLGNSNAQTLSIGSRVDLITKDSSNCTGNYSSTVPCVRDFSINFFDKTKASITSTPKVELCADSVKEESQFFRCLRNKNLRQRRDDKNSLNFSKYNSTEYFKDYTNRTDCCVNFICESQEDLSLSSSTSSKPERIGQSNDHGHTNLTHSCIDISSESSYSLTNGEFAKLHNSSLTSLNVKCEARPSLCSIENSSNYSSDMPSRVQGSEENVSTTQGSPTQRNGVNNIGCFLSFPVSFIKLLKMRCGNGNETSEAADSSDAEQVDKSDYSKAESFDQQKDSISHINSSEISENYSELSDSQGLTNLTNEASKESSLDCFSIATVELTELSNNSSSSRQGNLSSASQFSNNKSDDTSVKSDTSTSTVDHLKTTRIIDSNVSKRTRSGLKKLANASSSSQFVHSRKKPKMSASNRGGVEAATTLNVTRTSDKSTNSTVINNSNNSEPSQVESLDAEKIENSDYSNAESFDQQKDSISHINSSEISENYSELSDLQGLTNLTNEASKESSLDCCSMLRVEFSELSNNGSSRQGNLSSNRSDASQFSTEKSDNSSVESVILASNVKLTQIIDSNVSKRTCSGLKKLANASENILTQFVNPRKKQKILAVDVGADAANTLNETSTNEESTNSTVIDNSRHSGTCSRDEISQTFTSVCLEPEIPKPLQTNKENDEKTDFAPRNLMTNESTNTSQLTDKFQSSCGLRTLPARGQRKVSISGKTTHGSSSALDMQVVSIRRSKNNENQHNNLSTAKTMMVTDQVPRELFSDISNKMNSKNVTKRKRKKIVNTHNLPAIMESSAVDFPESKNIETTGPTENDARKLDTDTHSLSLHSGKWRRLLSVYRRHSISMRSAFLLEQTDVESINSLKVSLSNESNRQTLRHSVSFNLSRDNFADFNETSDRRAARRRRTSVVNPSVDVGRITEFDFVSTYDARDTILRRCGQSEPLEFADVYSEGALHQCRKIGEGVYGEVFMNKTDAGRAVVLKVIPIEGSLEVNGEPQKKFDEILSEIVIALQLSSLRNDKEYMTSSFAEVVQVRCVQGRYPNHLIDLWELYRDNHQTENDHPEIFTDDQLYIVFELANGGQDLEAFQFTNALQSKSAFQQMALALAIAEKKLQFEHRDLHWGNILLSPTDDKFVNFKFNGNTLQIPSEGIKVTIIDYTLSRMLYEGIVLYNDLSNDDELFTAHGDYQFDIYRLMKSNLDNDWQRFEPFNNILWLHYIIDKLINGARYKNTKSRKHRLAIEDLMVIRDEITNYKSAVDSVSNI